MAKRFITTDIFDDAWFMDLPNKYKLFWLYLITKCDYTGVWQVNYKTAQFYVGDHLEPTECERILKDRIVKIESGRYWFLPKFIEFQYGKELSKKNTTVKNVIKNLVNNGLLQHIPEIKIVEGASKELQSTLQGGKDKDKVKVKCKVEEESKINTLWQRTFGRNPNIPEYEETVNFIEKHGEETVYQTYKAAALRNIKSISYLMANIDSKGSLIPYEEKSKKNEIILDGYNNA